MLSRRRSALASPAVAPRPRGRVTPPPSPRDVYLSVIARVGSAVAVGAGDGGGLSADSCAVLLAELRALYRSLRACSVIVPAASCLPAPPVVPPAAPAAAAARPASRPRRRAGRPAG